MRYIFEDENSLGKLPIKNLQICFYDEDGYCYDESFIEPEKFDVYDLMYINDGGNYTRLFVNLLDGSSYELKLAERK